MRCPYCGGLSPDNSSDCIRCGRRSAPQQSARVQSPTANNQSQSGYPPPQFQSSTTPNPQRTVYPPTQTQARPQARPTVASQACPSDTRRPVPPLRRSRPNVLYQGHRHQTGMLRLNCSSSR